MTAMSMPQALSSAMDVMLARDPNVVIFGEDVGYFGGVFRCTEGLQKKYGARRVFDTPIAEGGIMGIAVGMGAYGLRPVAEIQFADYIYPAMDQIVSEAARLRYRSAGEFWSPITVRAPCGGGIFGGQTHSQSPEALFTHVCGIKTVIPSNPRDAKGLLIAAIEDDDPVVFLEPKRLYNGPFDGHHDKPVTPWSAHPLGDVPDEYYKIPLGKAAIVREGGDLTVLAYGTMVHVALAAAEESGVDAEVLDLRTLLPLDIDSIVASVKKTGRCIIVHEATRTSGFGAELSALVQEHCFYSLEAPVERVTGWDTPYPVAFEWAYFPGPKRVAEAFRRAMGLKMGKYVFKLPDVGEGTAQAEIAEWHVKVGDKVAEDQNLVDVTTDKATVELPSPVSGTIVALNGAPGDVIAVGSELVVLETEGEVRAPAPAKAEPAAKTGNGAQAPQAAKPVPPAVEKKVAPTSGKALAAPAVRDRARNLGVDLKNVAGSGPEGRVTHADLDAQTKTRAPVSAPPPSTPLEEREGVEEIKIIGIRRKIAERMQEAKRHIPHFAYVEEVDVTALEELRGELNRTYADHRPKLSVLPFIMCALVKATVEFPQVNALFDDAAGILRRHHAVHIGIATQTEKGLLVPVVFHAEGKDLWTCASEVSRVAEAARDGSIPRTELMGSTITITSLGKLGGIVTTPVINYPEVAIIGVNKIAERPMVRGGQVVIRQMMNLSSSFDHRVVDGAVAAEFIQRMKALLEQPATLFID